MPPTGAEIVNTLKITISPISSVTYRLTADQRWDRPVSRWVNESLPSCQALLTAHEVARLTRRPRWVLEALTLFKRFPKKQRFHGRQIGWRRHEVLLWLSASESCVGTAPLIRFNPEPQQRELQLRHPPCRRSRSHRSYCSSGRHVHPERPENRQKCRGSCSRNPGSTIPDRRKPTSGPTSDRP